MALNANPKANVPSGILNKQDVQNAQNPNAIELQKIVIDHIQKRKILLSMDSMMGNDSMAGGMTPLSNVNIPSHRKYDGFLSAVSPEYTINMNFLLLTKVSYTRDKEAFMFVFLMNKDQFKAPVSRDNLRTRIHILGHKGIFPKQRLIENEYPVDVSIAKYDDGYAPEEWNLILPSKKPREVKVALLWSF